jgi:hypothetical protein
MSENDSEAAVISLLRMPALALICSLFAICCFVAASKLGCGCADGNFNAAHFGHEKLAASR